MKFFQNKVILVTGAANGLGKALTTQLLEMGSTVIAVDIEENNLPEPGADCECRLRNYIVDVSIFKDVQNLVPLVASEFPSVDMLINNAGISYTGTVLDMEAREFQRVIDVNLVGTFNCTKAFLPLMLNNGGYIVNVCSGIAFMGLPRFSAYAASKAGIRTFSQSLRLELIEHSIHVTTAYPGPINTTIPNRSGHANDQYRTAQLAYLNKKGYDPHDVASVILRAVSQKKKDITIGWEVALGRRMALLFPRTLEWIIRHFRNALPV